MFTALFVGLALSSSFVLEEMISVPKDDCDWVFQEARGLLTKIPKTVVRREYRSVCDPKRGTLWLSILFEPRRPKLTEQTRAIALSLRGWVFLKHSLEVKEVEHMEIKVWTSVWEGERRLLQGSTLEIGTFREIKGVGRFIKGLTKLRVPRFLEFHRETYGEADHRELLGVLPSADGLEAEVFVSIKTRDNRFMAYPGRIAGKVNCTKYPQICRENGLESLKIQ